MRELGLVGERHVSRLTLLVHVSRLLDKPARIVIKGDSSTGKSSQRNAASRLPHLSSSTSARR